MLYLAAYNILKDQQACEDIIQELFIKLWNNRHTLHITVSLKAYLYASIRYAVYRQIRNGRVNGEVYEQLLNNFHAPKTYNDIEFKELMEQIGAVVNTLPDKCREVYKLSREEYLTHKQIAERLNISTKTVENHLTKALSYLRTSLGAVLTGFLMYWLLR